MKKRLSFLILSVFVTMGCASDRSIAAPPVTKSEVQDLNEFTTRAEQELKEPGADELKILKDLYTRLGVEIEGWNKSSGELQMKNMLKLAAVIEESDVTGEAGPDLLRLQKLSPGLFKKAVSALEEKKQKLIKNRISIEENLKKNGNG